MTVDDCTRNVLLAFRSTRSLATAALAILFAFLNTSIRFWRRRTVSCRSSWGILILWLSFAMWDLLCLLLTNLMDGQGRNHHWRFWLLNLPNGGLNWTVVTQTVFVRWTCLSAWLLTGSGLRLHALLRSRRLECEFTESFHLLLNISHSAKMFDVHLLAGVGQFVNCDFDLVHENVHLCVVLVVHVGQLLPALFKFGLLFRL